MKSVQRLQDLRASLGPGLLLAAAAIGVSHLIQATRAGADYGLTLLWAVLLVNLFKYPFLEYGPRYAVATGRSMLDGYWALSRYALGIYSCSRWARCSPFRRHWHW